MPWPIATSFRERSGNVRSSTLSTLVETPLRGPQQPALAPVREPEEDVHAERPRERRGEHRVDRAHVGEHRCGPRAAARARGRAPSRSAGHGPPGARRGTALTLQFSGSAPSTALSASTTSSSTRAASARSFVDGRPEHRAGRVDLLRDDDEPHRPPGLHGAAHELDDAVGVLVRRVRPLGRERAAAGAEALRELAVGEEPHEGVGDLGRRCRGRRGARSRRPGRRRGSRRPARRRRRGRGRAPRARPAASPRSARREAGARHRRTPSRRRPSRAAAPT